MKDKLFETKIYLSKQRTKVTRKLTDILMLMSEFGGFVKLMALMVYFFANPIIRFLYISVMAKRLYFAKTEREDLFKGSNKNQSSFVRHRLSKYTNKE